MRWLAIFGLAAVLGCTASKPEGMRLQKDGYSVIVIEGCEYIESPTSHGFFCLTHKGNCSNPIHSYASEASQ